jgi:two-component system, sensor histidine kinase
MLPANTRPPRAELKTRFVRDDAMRAPAMQSATRILIVDNDRRVGVALNFMLTARGFDEVRVVRSAARALAIAELFKPGLVFLDLELPDLESIAVAQQLRRDARQRGLRLIALTCHPEHGMREEARVAGFERYLTKPVVQDELDKILGKVGSAAA